MRRDAPDEDPPDAVHAEVSVPTSLSERRGVEGGGVPVAEAFARQRSRFLAMLASLSETDWRRPSRCEGWSVHDVVRHVRDVAAVHVDQLSTHGQAFDATQFDPRTTPAQWLRPSGAATPEETRAELDRLVAAEAELLARPTEGLWRGPARRMLHPSTFSTHLFWDAWMHERDITVSLGCQSPQSALETQLAVLYELLLAASVSTRKDDRVETTVALDGSPSRRYDIGYDDGGVLVVASSRATAALHAQTVPLLESLMGRGPAPHLVLDGPADLIERLGALRAVAA